MATSSPSPANETSQQKLARLLEAARANKAAGFSNPQIADAIKPNPVTVRQAPAPAPAQVSAISDALKAKLALLRAGKPALKPITAAINTLTHNSSDQATDRNGSAISYNEEQLRFINLASNGESAILIGAAGTGKTTSMKGTLTALVQSGRAGVLQADTHKHLISNTPGVVVIAFTRRAVANIRKNLPPDLQSNCLTYHALMEYAPEYYEVTDPSTGESKNTMQFVPSRSEFNPLPATIKTCVIEEASMFSVDYYDLLKGALPANVQFIFLGDIQQLPPVFGAAILGYKMLELPTVELVTVYRQALESPIIRLAHRILSGSPIPASEYTQWKYPGQLTIHPWKKKLSPDDACIMLAKFLRAAIDTGDYDPLTDMALIPFNKACGSVELNKYIAQHLARKRQALVWEIVAGFNKAYFSIGDKVLHDKEDAVITDIKLNPSYTGISGQKPSKTLDYWGFDGGDERTVEHKIVDESENDIDFLLSQSVAIGAGEEGTERVRQCSHIITIKREGEEALLDLSSAAEVNDLLLAYVLTVHKSQGSEFRKVFLLLHTSHATMLQRELLYTAVTRAKEELYIICEPETFTKGILGQRIKGNTLAEKCEYFKGKAADRLLN